MNLLFFKFLHILAGLWLTAGVFGSTVARVQLKRAGGTAVGVPVARILWRLHVVYTLPGLVLVGLFGVHLVTATPLFRFDQIWIATSLLLWVFMFLWTLFAITPALSRLRRAAETVAEGEEGAFARLAGGRLWGILSDLNALGILVLTYLMVMRP
jgi:uncharacterized membrane protein